MLGLGLVEWSVCLGRLGLHFALGSYPAGFNRAFSSPSALGLGVELGWLGRGFGLGRVV